ncbi:DUF3618 domain-containing protein [Nonomuraea sp. NPDC047897]|uniref:DUF3618 domain-containing protein n=1 Tax=Nonomuraea sp. NPDC047897 TaxID=3364346 RepID=UPI003713DC52
MSETDPGHSEQHAGQVGAHRSTVGAPTDHESINVPQTRPGAEENARRAEAARDEHEVFDPEPPLPDERTALIEDREGEARSQTRSGDTHSDTRSDTRSDIHHDPHTGDPRTGGARSGTPRPGRDRRAAPSRRADTGNDDEEEHVRNRIQETREDMGDTVAALAHKADVKARASEAAETAKGKAAEVAGTVKGKTAEVAGTVRGRTAEVAGTAKGKATEVAGKVREVTPEQVKDAADKVTGQARKRPVLLLAAAGAVGVLVMRRMRARRTARPTRRFRGR